MSIPPNLLAQASNTGVSPEQRAKLRKLMTDDLFVNPAFQPAEEQAFSLAGNQPIGGGGAAGIGSALLGAPPPLDPQATEVKRPGFHETTGGEMAKGLLAKRKNLKWWTPDFMADRNERDLNTALRLAAAEMGGAEGQALEAQAKLDRIERRRTEATNQSRWEAEMAADKEKRQADIARMEADGELSRAKALALTSDVAEGRENAVKPPVYKPGPAPAYDVYDPNPTSTGVFSKFAAQVMGKDTETDPAEVLRAQVNTSKAGGLPRMQSSRKDSPPVVVGPDGREYWYQNGELVPAKPLDYPNMAPLSPRGPR